MYLVFTYHSRVQLFNQEMRKKKGDKYRHSGTVRVVNTVYVQLAYSFEAWYI